MSSAASQSDELFWLAYCDVIKKQLGKGFGSSSAIFFCTQTQRGPPAGDGIHEAFTNIGVYDIGDNLLQPDNLFYVPSSQNSYIKSLNTYLGWVDLGGRPSDVALLRIKRTSEDMESAHKKMMTELPKALADYSTIYATGMLGQTTFPEWVGQNAPSYMNAQNMYEAAAAANQDAVNNTYGPQAQQYNTDKKRIHDAMTSLTYLPGVNMPCTSLVAANARELLNAQNSGQSIPAPTAIYYQPEYRCTSYTETVKSWQNKTNTYGPPANSANLTISYGKSVNKKEFGQTAIGGDLSFGFIPCFSFGAHGKYDKSEERLETDDSSQEITITMTWDTIRAVTINPGRWNIGDPKNTYKLRPDAPASARLLVCPKQMILINKLGYTVSFGSKMSSAFDKKINHIRQVGGHVKLLGLPIKVGGDVNVSPAADTSHTGTWDSAKGEFTVKPSDDGGFASVVAIVGEKVSTV